MRATSDNRRAQPGARRAFRPAPKDRQADSVPHVVVQAVDLPVDPDVPIPEWLARHHQLVTQRMIARRFGISTSTLTYWLRLRDFPARVAVLGDSMRHPQHLYRWSEVEAWVANYRPKYLRDR